MDAYKLKGLLAIVEKTLENRIQPYYPAYILKFHNASHYDFSAIYSL